MDDVFVSYSELEPGDIFVGSSITYEWLHEYIIIGRTPQGKVRYCKVDDDSDTYLLGDYADRKYRLKQTAFKYNPDQTGDTEDDI